MGYFVAIFSTQRSTCCCLLVTLMMLSNVVALLDADRRQNATHLGDNTWHSVYLRRREHVLHVAVDDKSRYTSSVRLNDNDEFNTIHVGLEQPEADLQMDEAQTTSKVTRNKKPAKRGTVVLDSSVVQRGRRASSSSSSSSASSSSAASSSSSSSASSSSTISGNGKLGFIGLMQQLVFDGRELSELDTDDTTGSDKRNHFGQAKSTAVVDTAGGPMTFGSSEAYVEVKTKVEKHTMTSSTLSVYFQMKTSQTDGIIFAAWLPLAATTVPVDPVLGHRAFVGLELSAGHLRYVFASAGSSGSATASPGGSLVSIRGPAGQHPINDNRWHSVGVNVFVNHSTASSDALSSLVNERHTLHVDNSSKSETFQRLVSTSKPPPSRHHTRVDAGAVAAQSEWWQSSAPVELFVGGLPAALLYSLPKQIKSREGYQGCLSSLELNGEQRSLLDPVQTKVPVEHTDNIRSGCSGPTRRCSEKACENGGQCIQQWDSYYCDCEMTSFTGPTCAEDSVAYKFGDRGGGLIDFRFSEDERPDTKHDVIAFGFNTRQSDAVLLRITGATSNDFIEIELVDGYPYVVYNVGLMDHRVGGPGHPVDDNLFHVLRVVRSGPNATLTIDDRPSYSKHLSGRQLSVFNGQSKVEVGAVRDVSSRRLMRTFQGTIVGLVVNRLRILDLAAEADPRVTVQGDIELDTKPLRPSSSFGSMTTRFPGRDGARGGWSTTKTNSVSRKTPTSRKPSVGNDLIFSGSGNDEETACISWSDELCPPSETASDDDALILPTTQRARSRTTESREDPVSSDDDDWSGSRSSVDCAYDDEEDDDCRSTASSLTVSTSGDRRSQKRASTKTLSSFTTVPTPLITVSGRKTVFSRSPSTAIVRQTTTSAYFLARLSTSLDDVTSPATRPRSLQPVRTTPLPTTSTSSPTHRPLAVVSLGPTTVQPTAPHDQRSSVSIVRRPVAVDDPSPTAHVRPTYREVYSVPVEVDEMPSNQSPAVSHKVDVAVPMNITLIVGVIVAIVVLVCMLVYVIVKWSQPHISGPTVNGNGAPRQVARAVSVQGHGEKTAMPAFETRPERLPPVYSGSIHNSSPGLVLENGKQPRSSAPVNEKQPRSLVPVNGKQLRSSAPVNGKQPRSSSPVNGKQPRSLVPVNGKQLRSSAPVNGKQPRSSSPVNGKQPRSLVPVNGKQLRSSAPVYGKQPRSLVPVNGKQLRSSAPVNGKQPRSSSPVAVYMGNSESEKKRDVQEWFV